MSEKQIPVQPKHKDVKKETLTGHALWAGGLPDAGCVCVCVCWGLVWGRFKCIMYTGQFISVSFTSAPPQIFRH